MFGLTIEFRTYGSRIRRFVKQWERVDNFCNVG